MRCTQQTLCGCMDGTDPEISRTIITSARTKAKEYNSTGPIVVCRLRHRQRIIQARERERERARQSSSNHVHSDYRLERCSCSGVWRCHGDVIGCCCCDSAQFRGLPSSVHGNIAVCRDTGYRITIVHHSSAISGRVPNNRFGNMRPMTAITGTIVRSAQYTQFSSIQLLDYDMSLSFLNFHRNLGATVKHCLLCNSYFDRTF